MTTPIVLMMYRSQLWLGECPKEKTRPWNAKDKEQGRFLVSLTLPLHPKRERLFDDFQRPKKNVALHDRAVCIYVHVTKKISKPE